MKYSAIKEESSTGIQNVRKKKLNWVEITKLNCHQSRKIISEHLQTKISGTHSLLTQSYVKPAYEPKSTALYFRNVRRSSVRAIRKPLLECLPTWALFGLDFVGSSIMEVVTDGKLIARVKTTVKLIGTSIVPDFDVFKSALSAHNTDDPSS